MNHVSVPSHTQTYLTFLFSILFLIGMVACSGDESSPPPSSTAAAQAGTPGAEEAVGERLFLETRLAQAFKVFVDNGGNINDPNIGDPVVETLATSGAPIAPGPFKGLSMNCRACHLVDDVVDEPGGGMRSYADFARRSPIPAREDGRTVSVRNSPPLVNAALDRPGGVLFHFDAEFNSMEDVVAATFADRQLGWLPGEKAQAIAHIAKVIRGDDGTGDLAKEFGGTSYRMLFAGTDPAIPEDFRLLPEFRLFVESASDQQIFDAVVKLVSAYVNGLLFSQAEESGALIRSPFDVFLKVNDLPEQPDQDEPPIEYNRRLLQLVKARELAGTLQFVTSNPHRADGQFQFHTQPFSFGAKELAGLKIFLAEPSATPPSKSELTAGKIGNCIACHAAPNFTDFKMHNTGTTQREYDLIHGTGQFAKLSIPDLATRNGNYDAFLPATENHPKASARFRAIPVLANPTLTDLGLWNAFANPDMPNPQSKIRAILCDAQVPCPLSDSALLDQAIASFKTPSLRDLDHSAPFMHNGQFDTLDDIIDFYIDVSDQSREGTLRNGADQLRGIALKPNDNTSLAAFLKSLNEDYQ